jgi:hypothetical protein
MIGDTVGYDKCRHVHATDNNLWLADSGFRVHPIYGTPGDDLPDGRRPSEVVGKDFRRKIA